MEDNTKLIIEKQETKFERNQRIADEIIQAAIQCSPEDVKKYME